MAWSIELESPKQIISAEARKDQACSNPLLVSAGIGRVCEWPSWCCCIGSMHHTSATGYFLLFERQHATAMLSPLAKNCCCSWESKKYKSAAIKSTHNISWNQNGLLQLVQRAPGLYSKKKSFIDVFYHQIQNGIQGCTTRAPPFSRGGRGRTGDQTIASPMPWPLGHDIPQ